MLLRAVCCWPQAMSACLMAFETISGCQHHYALQRLCCNSLKGASTRRADPGQHIFVCAPIRARDGIIVPAALVTLHKASSKPNNAFTAVEGFLPAAEGCPEQQPHTARQKLQLIHRPRVEDSTRSLRPGVLEDAGQEAPWRLPYPRPGQPCGLSTA